MRHNKALPLTTENMLKSRGGNNYSINKPLVIGFILKGTLNLNVKNVSF